MPNSIPFMLKISELADGALSMMPLKHSAHLSTPFTRAIPIVSYHQQLQPHNNIQQQITLIFWQTALPVNKYLLTYFFQPVTCWSKRYIVTYSDNNLVQAPTKPRMSKLSITSLDITA